MQYMCYGKKFGKLDKCQTCECKDYCKDAGDCKLSGKTSYDDISYSESVADPHTPVPFEDKQEPKEFTVSQVCDILRRMIELNDDKIRDILRLKIAYPDISIYQIAVKYGVSKQAIHQYIKRAIAYCPELAVVLCNRPMYNKWRKDRNIRITYRKRKVPTPPFCEQMSLL